MSSNSRRERHERKYPFAGKSTEPSMLVNLPRLVAAYYTKTSEPSVPEQRVSFGTSHRGSAFEEPFNERYILAISQAICLYRERKKIDGQLFLGMDTHAFTAKPGRKLYEVPVGFKWFVDGLLDGSLGFAGEENAGASFVRLDGSVWTTDKDGIVQALLAAEIAARPSGTEDIYKIYAESFQGTDHLRRILEEARRLSTSLCSTPDRSKS